MVDKTTEAATAPHNTFDVSQYLFGLPLVDELGIVCADVMSLCRPSWF